VGGAVRNNGMIAFEGPIKLGTTAAWTREKIGLGRCHSPQTDFRVRPRWCRRSRTPRFPGFSATKTPKNRLQAGWNVSTSNDDVKLLDGFAKPLLTAMGKRNAESKSGLRLNPKNPLS